MRCGASVAALHADELAPSFDDIALVDPMIHLTPTESKISAIDASHAEASSSLIETFLWGAIGEWWALVLGAVGVDVVEEGLPLFGCTAVVAITVGKIAVHAIHLGLISFAHHDPRLTLSEKASRPARNTVTASGHGASDWLRSVRACPTI